MAATDPLIFLLAGEPSGDALGGRLMAALARLTGGRVRFVGIGGPAMEARGLASLFPMEELSVMGLAEVLPRAPHLWRRMGETASAIRATRPDAVVTIDAPSFCSGVWRRLGRTEARLIHYVAPTVWAWRPGRARHLARRIDHLMCLLPFEPPFFEREGLKASFVGHPVVETGARRADGSAFRAAHRIPSDATTLSVLPGSRRGEVARMLPPFGAAVTRLAARDPDLVVLVPTVPAVAEEVRWAIAPWPARTMRIQDEAEKYAAMAASNAALAASGTVALELALARVPSMIAYKVNPLTAAILRRLVRVEHVNLVNILLGREAVPELLQADCTPDRLAAALTRLIEDGTARAAQIAAVTEAAALLGADGPPPSERAARVVLDEIGWKAVVGQL